MQACSWGRLACRRASRVTSTDHPYRQLALPGLQQAMLPAANPPNAAHTCVRSSSISTAPHFVCTPEKRIFSNTVYVPSVVNQPCGSKQSAPKGRIAVVAQVRCVTTLQNAARGPPAVVNWSRAQHIATLGWRSRRRKAFTRTRNTHGERGRVPLRTAALVSLRRRSGHEPVQCVLLAGSRCKRHRPRSPPLRAFARSFFSPCPARFALCWQEFRQLWPCGCFASQSLSLARKNMQTAQR